MPRISAGLLLYRHRARTLEVFLIHMGGPFWADKDEGAWSIPKGEVNPDEDYLTEAKREFQEETGQVAPEGPYTALTPIRQKAGKLVYAWMAEGGDINAENIVSNTFRVEWPPRSGRWQSYPEADRAAWLDMPTARAKLLPSQAPLLDQLEEILKN